MNIIVSHPTGNANLRAALKGIDAGSNLLEFHTSIATDPQAAWLKLIPSSLREELLRRTFPISRKKIITHPFKEIARLGFPKIGFDKWSEHEVGKFSVDAVYRSLDKDVSQRIGKYGKTKVDAIYAYEDGALSSFRMARKLGITTLYDLPIGYWRAARKLMQEEMDLNPEWSTTLVGFKDSAEKLQRKDEELKLADHVFVASSFTRKTLESFPDQLSSVHVIPYGFPKPGPEKEYKSLNGRKLKVLFVGGLSQRKGLSYLFNAVDSFSDKIELTVVGKKPAEDCIPLNKALDSFRWISSLPHAEILNLMREHDVFVFPSLFEGFGLVVTEAMSQGIPVITTDRTCGPDVISPGQDGWIVRAGNTDDLKAVLDGILAEPDQLEAYGRAARKKAQTRPWSVYGNELNAKICSL